MRICEIEIKNFKAFYGPYKIDLCKSGHSLLVYGENGSGKTSLYQALMLFLESSVKDINFEKHRNIFVKGEEDSYIKLVLRKNKSAESKTYQWSKSVCETKGDSIIIEASKAKGFFDYKGLLLTHFIHREKDYVNVFNLLVESILANAINDVTGNRFIDDWNDVKKHIPKKNTYKRLEVIEEKIKNFNLGMSNKLKELKTKANKILSKFDYKIGIDDLTFPGITYDKQNHRIDNQDIILKVKFFDKYIQNHHTFLNEAKLTAIAISIYFSSLLLQPQTNLKILVLDDILIGLDMSNRLPVIDILKEYFADYQKFFITYDRAWYEIVKQRTQGEKWKSIELYFSQSDSYELPLFVENKKYLDKAKDFKDKGDYKASVIYLRTAFEEILKWFCDKKDLKVRFKLNPKKLQSQYFWTAVIEKKDDGNPKYLTNRIINDIELYRSIILNPLCHANITETFKTEVNKTIQAVENLETELKSK